MSWTRQEHLLLNCQVLNQFFSTLRTALSLYFIDYPIEELGKVLFQKDQSVSGLTEIKEVGSQERLLDEEWIFTGKVREKEIESVAAIAAEMR